MQDTALQGVLDVHPYSKDTKDPEGEDEHAKQSACAILAWSLFNF